MNKSKVTTDDKAQYLYYKTKNILGVGGQVERKNARIKVLQAPRVCNI